MPRKGRARRFREARELKQGYDDGLFREGSGTLADVDSKSDDKFLKFACLKACLRVAEWRLNRPDAQRANSFINSEIKPPP